MDGVLLATPPTVTTTINTINTAIRAIAGLGSGLKGVLWRMVEPGRCEVLTSHNTRHLTSQITHSHHYDPLAHTPLPATSYQFTQHTEELQRGALQAQTVDLK